MGDTFTFLKGEKSIHYQKPFFPPLVWNVYILLCLLAVYRSQPETPQIIQKWMFQRPSFEIHSLQPFNKIFSQNRFGA